VTRPRTRLADGHRRDRLGGRVAHELRAAGHRRPCLHRSRGRHRDRRRAWLGCDDRRYTRVRFSTAISRGRSRSSPASRASPRTAPSRRSGAGGATRPRARSVSRSGRLRRDLHRCRRRRMSADPKACEAPACSRSSAPTSCSRWPVTVRGSSTRRRPNSRWRADSRCACATPTAITRARVVADIAAYHPDRSPRRLAHRRASRGCASHSRPPRARRRTWPPRRVYRAMADASVSLDMFTPVGETLVFSVAGEAPRPRVRGPGVSGTDLPGAGRSRQGHPCRRGHARSAGRHGAMAEYLDVPGSRAADADSHTTISVLVPPRRRGLPSQALHRRLRLCRPPEPASGRSSGDVAATSLTKHLMRTPACGTMRHVARPLDARTYRLASTRKGTRSMTNRVSAVCSPPWSRRSTDDLELDLPVAQALAHFSTRAATALSCAARRGESRPSSTQKMDLFPRGHRGGRRQAPVIANAGDNCTADSVEFARRSPLSASTGSWRSFRTTTSRLRRGCTALPCHRRGRRRAGDPLQHPRALRINMTAETTCGSRTTARTSSRSRKPAAT
jgi:hypothetical protein